MSSKLATVTESKVKSRSDNLGSGNRVFGFGYLFWVTILILINICDKSGVSCYGSGYKHGLR